MVCPNCGLSLAGANAQVCPRCGHPLHVLPTQMPGYGYADAAQGAPVSSASDYSAQPLAQPDMPFYGQAAPPSYPPSSYPAYGPPGMPPAYPPAYPPYEHYGQGAPVTTPFYGQAASPSYPMYGPPSPSAYPPPGWPGAQPQPQPRRGNALVIGLSIGVVAVILLAAIGAVATVQSARDSAANSAAATPTATSTATTKPGKTVLFTDPLTSNKNGWPDDDHCSFASDGYHIKGGWTCVAPMGTLADFDFTVHVKQISGPLTYGYGIAFRRASAGSDYQFGIDGNSKWVLFKCVSHSCSKLVDWTSNGSLRGGLNIAHTMEVQANGPHIVCFADGTRLGSVDDSTYLSGDSGLVGSENIEAVFTNLTITSM